jgi:uncharacterized protein (TIGR02646 family)
MRPFTRTDAPQLLRENAEAWGKEYAAKKTADPSYTFRWKTVKGKRVNTHILPEMKTMTDEHCAYCDSYPPGKSDNTIDHFFAKGDKRFYHLVYEWVNLYFCCAVCQSYKKEKYDPRSLRPDALGYQFATYFDYNFTLHEIKVNQRATPDDQAKAYATIELFGLNDPKHVRTRRAFYTEYNSEIEKGKTPDLKDFPYRFMFEL